MVSKYPPPVIPKALRPGGTIAFIAPSSRIHETIPSTITRAKALFEDKYGYRVKTTYLTTEDAATRTVASHIEVRKAEILAAFADPEVDAIICTVGGATLTELMPAFLHDEAALDVLRQNPKILVGMSDISFLHWLLRSQTGLRTFYGPTVISELGEFPEPMPYSIDNLLRAITSSDNSEGGSSSSQPPQPLGLIPQSSEYRPGWPSYFENPDSAEPCTYAPTPRRRWLRHGKAEGRIFGGCLSVVVRLGGDTALVPDWNGRIVFLETSMAEVDDNIGVPLFNIRRQLADMVSQGVFDRVAGFIMGRSFGYDTDAQIAELDQLIRELIIENPWVKNKTYGEFPVLSGVDITHTSPMMTLPMDALVRLDSEKDEFSVLEAGVY